ncbi:MAG: zinc ribbon domain-containing protein [Dehalococcoidales bacterium]|nr:zinc ribbon domain-containing protein [Dehalococcoidales bacterium]
MPPYKYECEKCHAKFEVRRGIFDKKREVKCPACGETKVRQVYSFITRNSCGPSTTKFPT